MSSAFRRFGATQANVQWAVSAIASDGACVIAGWSHHLKRHDGGLRLKDKPSRFSNRAGRNLLRQHLEQVAAEGLAIRLVMTTTEDPKDRRIVDEGLDASRIKKTFSAREDLVGSLSKFDGDEFLIDFAAIIGQIEN